MQIRDADIGGGVVGRGFQCGDQYLKRGVKLTREQILKMPAANRGALIDKGMLVVFPRGSDDAERFVVPVKGGFDVFAGTKLNVQPLTEDEALALAGKDSPKKAAPKKKAKAKPKGKAKPN